MNRSCLLCGLATLFAISFSGCRGPQALKTTFHQYSEAYATTVNEQMLLNLARKANGHPAYFLQMGSINATFSFSAAGGGNVTSSRYNNQIGPGILTQGITGGGNLSISGAETPTFTFTPLAGSSFANAIFAPINAKIFFDLLEQGRPVDQLMRTMVNSIDVTYTQPGKPDKTITILNVIDAERQENYRNFLRLAGLYRELQKAELLSVASSGPGGPGFGFRNGAELRIAELVKRPEYQLEPESEWAAAHVEELPTNTVPVTTLRLRTFEGVLTALANEYQTYDKVIGSGNASIPTSEREPILRFEGKGFDPSTSLVDITYKGKKYEIGDLSPTNTWNRDVFILLSQLFTQVALDPNKLPVQQLIQVR